MTVDECLQKFAQTGITSFLPSAVATANGLDQETVCQQLRDLVEDGRLKLYHHRRFALGVLRTWAFLKKT